MMKILIEGVQRYDEGARVLECRACGCIFKTDEYKIDGFEMVGEGFRKCGFTAKCPCCGRDGHKRWRALMERADGGIPSDGVRYTPETR